MNLVHLTTHTYFSFPRFPKDPDRLKEWCVRIRRDDHGKLWTPKGHAFLCCKHFSEDCFDRTGQTVRLHEGALPTIFDFPLHLQVGGSLSVLCIWYKHRPKESINCMIAADTSFHLWVAGTGNLIKHLPKHSHLHQAIFSDVISFRILNVQGRLHWFIVELVIKVIFPQWSMY